jgi:hypothetical protein
MVTRPGNWFSLSRRTAAPNIEEEIMGKTRTGRRGVFAAIAGGALAVAAFVALAPTAAQAAAAPEVFSGFDNSTSVSGSATYSRSITVPAGNYIAMAKLSVFNSDSSSIPTRVETCQLTLGNSFDRAFTRLENGDEQVLTMNVVGTFTAPSPITLTCNSSSGSSISVLEFVKISAIRVNSLSNVSIS